MDSFTEWASEDLIPTPGQRALLSDVYEAWRNWAKPQGLAPGRKNDFQAKLERRKYKVVKIDRTNYVLDIAPPQPQTGPSWPDRGF